MYTHDSCNQTIIPPFFIYHNDTLLRFDKHSLINSNLLENKTFPWNARN